MVTVVFAEEPAEMVAGTVVQYHLIGSCWSLRCHLASWFEPMSKRMLVCSCRDSRSPHCFLCLSLAHCPPKLCMLIVTCELWRSQAQRFLEHVQLWIVCTSQIKRVRLELSLMIRQDHHLRLKIADKHYSYRRITFIPRHCQSNQQSQAHSAVGLHVGVHIPSGFLRGWNELERDAVNTVSLVSRRFKSFPFEYMPQMPSAGSTCDLCSPPIRIRLVLKNKIG